MVWKTVLRENRSAIADDGIVTFEALGGDTLVTIWGRQHFCLPPLWAALDRELTPAMKRALVSEAYGRFFARTFANLEAVAEGRDVRIGRAWSEASEGEPLPVERLSDAMRRLQRPEGFDLMATLKSAFHRPSEARPEAVRIDADGFHHFEPLADRTEPGPAASALSAALQDLRHAAWVDAGAQG
jgi:hypothetical protein